MTRSIAEPTRSSRTAWARRDPRVASERLHEAAVEIALLVVLAVALVVLWGPSPIYTFVASLVASASSFFVALGAGLVVMAVAAIALGGPARRTS